MSYRLDVVAMMRVCGAAVVGAAVGAAVGVVAGVWLVHPAKQAARNSITNTVEINPTCTSLLISITGIMVDNNTIQCFLLLSVKRYDRSYANARSNRKIQIFIK